MRTIAVMNQKGGVGKTTTAINTGAGLASLGARVLLVDLDPQAHLTYSLGIAAHELPKTVYELLKDEASLAEVTVGHGDINVLPSSMHLSGADIEFSVQPGRDHILEQALESVQGYDYILMDCPPNLGLLTVNALTAAHEILVPMQPEYLALQSLSKLMETVRVVQRRLNPKLEVSGIVATRHAKRRKLNREVMKTIRDYFGDVLFETTIRENVALAEAPSFGKTIFEYRPSSNGALDYLNLSKELHRRRTQ
jgi:chromosome partitioning protein